MSEPNPCPACDPVQERTNRTWNRLAPHYDARLLLLEKRLARWRLELLGGVRGRVLEVGAGTGANLPHYPPGIELVLTDPSVGMLHRARARSRELGLEPAIEPAPVQNLSFPDSSFDAVVSTLVFCNVPDPAAGLAEIRRVLKPAGRLLMIEHVRPPNPFLATAFSGLDLFTSRIWGEHLTRQTAREVAQAGFELVEDRPLWLWGVFRRIVGRLPPQAASR